MARTLELQLTLQERVDRNGNMYLYGGLFPIPVVLFIHPVRGDVEGEGRRWSLTVKPYTPRSEDTADNDSAIWEDDSQTQKTRTKKSKGRNE